MTGLRAILNYGHTFGHPLESLTGYGQILHGEAVSIGMIQAARLAARLGRVDEAFVRRQEDLLTKLQLPTEMPKGLGATEILEAMQHDKKVSHGRLRLILPMEMGKVEMIGEIDEADILAAITG